MRLSMFTPGEGGRAAYRDLTTAIPQWVGNLTLLAVPGDGAFDIFRAGSLVTN